MLVWVIAGFGISGFAIILADLVLRIPGLGTVIEPFIQRFFPPVEDGMGVLISALLFLGAAFGVATLAKKSK